MMTCLCRGKSKPGPPCVHGADAIATCISNQVLLLGPISLTIANISIIHRSSVSFADLHEHEMDGLTPSRSGSVMLGEKAVSRSQA